MAAVLDRDEKGNLVRKAGIMGVVLMGGEVKPGDSIHVERQFRFAWKIPQL
jgi:MOSC domain-containing protein YiiM